MMERFRKWHEILMERLSDPEDVISYLKVSLEHNKKLLVIDVKQVNTKRILRFGRHETIIIRC